MQFYCASFLFRKKRLMIVFYDDSNIFLYVNIKFRENDKKI